MYQAKQLLLQCFGECSCSVSCVCKMLVFFSEVRIEAAFLSFLKPSYLHSKEFGVLKNVKAECGLKSNVFLTIQKVCLRAYFPNRCGPRVAARAAVLQGAVTTVNPLLESSVVSSDGSTHGSPASLLLWKRRVDFSLPYESPAVSASSRPVLLSQSQFRCCAPFASLLIAALDSWTTVLAESPSLCISISRR
ncbi:hypothetical protein MJG53_002913 [Ovis ammon polii x Ovis aries]|uniref:Uncharacterized protein n=1 Tax=Ovis ammon polii x Ovis aries TaxID=2918886 RepID=A0ACB9VG94_9CETA|nr:hypothetical protein MJT46_004256 [Ovis ammon polii x Ovis aries]KAI4588505.1 hypothetical protein MJG53_002913 [Ovis ammon polii x Ovis aries]